MCLLHLVSRVKFTDEPDVVAARVRMPSGRGTTASSEKQEVNIDKKMADCKIFVFQALDEIFGGILSTNFKISTSDPTKDVPG